MMPMTGLPSRETLKAQMAKSSLLMVLIPKGQHADPFLLMQVSIAIELDRLAFVLLQEGAQLPPALESSGLIAQVFPFTGPSDLEPAVEKLIDAWTQEYRKREEAPRGKLAR